MGADAVGNRIREAREAAGFPSRAEFARQVEIAEETLWRYENGRRAPGVEALSSIADACRVSLDWLARGLGEGPAVTDATDATDAA